MKTLLLKPWIVSILLICCCRLGFAQINPATPKASHQVTDVFIQQNLVYPEADLQAGNKGKVVVAFRLDEHGNGSDYQVKETFSEAANDNALHGCLLHEGESGREQIPSVPETLALKGCAGPPHHVFYLI